MELTHLKDGMLKERAREIVKYQNFATKSAFSKMSQKMPSCVFNAGVVYLKNGTINPHISNRLKSMLDECISEHVQPLIPKDNERRKFKGKSYQKLYEDKLDGNLTEERFNKLSESYDQEQKELETRIKELQDFIDNEKEKYLNASYLINIVKKYTEINELTDEIVHEFIQKIVIHHKVKINGVKTQQIDIYYNGIGHVEI